MRDSDGTELTLSLPFPLPRISELVVNGLQKTSSDFSPLLLTLMCSTLARRRDEKWMGVVPYGGIVVEWLPQ